MGKDRDGGYVWGWRGCDMICEYDEWQRGKRERELVMVRETSEGKTKENAYEKKIYIVKKVEK